MKTDFHNYELVDSSGQLSEKFLRAHAFEVLMFPGETQLIHVELFCAAMRKRVSILEKIIFLSDSEYDISEIAPDRTFMEGDLCSSNGVIIFDQKWKGIFFKGLLDEFYIVAGDIEFMNDFYPVSHKLVDEILFAWISSPAHKPDKAKYYRDLAKKYMPFRFENSK